MPFYPDIKIEHNGHIIRGKDRKRIVWGLAKRKQRGATISEVTAALGKAANGVSGCLSILHGQGHVALLAEQRGEQQIYVLPKYVGDRETVPRRQHHCDGCGCFK